MTSVRTKMMDHRMVKMETAYRLNCGEPGEDKDVYNPLARAFANLLQTGQPFQRLVQCFVLDDRDQSSKNGQRIRWLGVFVYSAGNRVIFFPGFAYPMTEVHLVHQTEPKLSQPFQIDHFSLEADLRRWHITNEDSSKHMPGRGIRTRSLSGGYYLWFGLSISSLDVLRIVKERTLVTAQAPELDAQRRSDVFFESRENVLFPQLEFHPRAMMSDLHTAHFSIIVGNGSGTFYEENALSLP